MAEAAIQAATPAAPTVAPTASEPTESLSAGSHGLDAILGDLSADDVAEPSNDGADVEDDVTEPAEVDADTAQQDGKGKKPPPDDLIFSDEQLKTPEGIRRARDRVKELRTLQHKAYLGLKQHERNVNAKAEKLRAKVASFRSEKQTHMLLVDNVRSNLQGLHSGDPDTMITALGNLTGQDGVKAYELLTSRIVNKGRAPLDPQIQALIDGLKAEVTELKGGLQQREAQQTIAQKAARIDGHKAAIGKMMADATAYPNLARIFADSDQEAEIEQVVNDITARHARGEAVDAREYFASIESQLARHFGGSQAPSPGTGGGPAPKQPATAQRSPGTSVGPRTAAASTSRVPSEEESLRAIANDPDLLSALGL